jgi:hypothetical protein
MWTRSVNGYHLPPCHLATDQYSSGSQQELLLLHRYLAGHASSAAKPAESAAASRNPWRHSRPR